MSIWRQWFQNKAAHNFAWLCAEKAIRILITVSVGSWVARYLGAQEFGLLSYAIAWIAIVAGMAGLGLDALAVRDLVARPGDGGTLLGTVILLRSIACLLGGVIILGLVFVLRPDEYRTWWMVAVLGVGIVFQGLESGDLWFQARLQMRQLVVPRLALFCLVNLVKVAFVLSGAEVLAFVHLSAVEMIASGLITFIYVRWSKHGAGPLTVDVRRGWSLLVECWPLAVSGLAVTLYMKVTQLILATLLGDKTLGVYSAATRISEAANFVPMILASSLLPSLLKSQDGGAINYKAARMRYFRLNALFGYCLCLPMSAGASTIVKILYNTGFEESTPVLAVHAWTLLFVFMGVARAQHFLNERATRWMLGFTLSGLIINIAFSLLFIPLFGALGAAWAVVVGYAFSTIGTSFIFPATRQIGREQVLALVTPWLALQSLTRDDC